MRSGHFETIGTTGHVPEAEDASVDDWTCTAYFGELLPGVLSRIRPGPCVHARQPF